MVMWPVLDSLEQRRVKRGDLEAREKVSVWRAFTLRDVRVGSMSFGSLALSVIFK